jgi:hypothetical protein
VARLIDDPFTVENGFLTPTFKTKRPQLTAFYGPTVLKELIAETHALEESTSSRLVARRFASSCLRVRCARIGEKKNMKG